MSKQIHKRFITEQVKNILARYETGRLRAKEAIRYLELSRPHFYELVNEYIDNSADFSIDYVRNTPTRKLDSEINRNILKELKFEREKIIDNPNVPTKRYNYSYIKKRIKEKYNQEVSVPTIINRAKDAGYWQGKPPKAIHDREVITNYVGELIRHDSSHHLFAPDAEEKWYLITSLDDYSRKMLYADFWLRETAWAHINALQEVFLTYGMPLQYYPDQHSIFRYVRNRDKNSPWQALTKFTDEADPQWKQVMNDCGVKVIYALSPQAKGKMERPYGWLQDHIVRTCVREGITKIEDGREILRQEVRAYNGRRVHSTTKEIPDIRFRRAIREKKSLFREFSLKPPFQSAKDIFCLRAERIADAYRKISIEGCEFRVPGATPGARVELRIYPDLEKGVTEVRFWQQGKFLGAQRAKIENFPIVRF